MTLTLPRGHKRTRRPERPSNMWMSDEEIAAYEYEPGGVLLGKQGQDFIGMPATDDRHLLTVAGSRAGKSSTCLKPNLAVYPGSVLCIDPKGELARETAAIRARMGQDVYILDPFNQVKNEAKEWRCSFDPLDELLAGEADDTVDDAALIADALIVPNKGESSDHWQLSAKNLLRGLILFLLQMDRDNAIDANLTNLRGLINLPWDSKSEDVDTLHDALDTMASMDHFDGTLAGVGGTMLGKPENERGSIISTAVEQTSFLDSKPMKDFLAGEGRRLETLRQLKRTPTTVYLVLPASRMSTHFRWFRVIVTLALAALEREETEHEHPVLFILEEFPQLGYMRQIEAAAGLMAGYGVKLWTVVQDLTQIKSLYRDTWETFIGNAGVVQAFGNTDATTVEYISRHLGTVPMTQKTETRPSTSSMGAGAARHSEDHANPPLLAPFEVAQYAARDTGQQIVMMAGKQPIYLERIPHDDVDMMLAG